MRARLHDLTLARDGGYLLTISTRENIGAMFDELHGADIDVTVKKYREKRSLDANAMCWKICTDIANAIGSTKEDVYREAIRTVGVYTPLPIKANAVDEFQRNWESRGNGWVLEVIDDSKLSGYKLCFAYFGSSTYNTAEMSRLIDNLIDEAKNVGVEVISERERSLLIEDWENTK